MPSKYRRITTVSTRNKVFILNFEGTSGVGKTTLLEELAKSFRKMGHVVLEYKDATLPIPGHAEELYLRGIINVFTKLMTQDYHDIVILTERLFSYAYTDPHKCTYALELSRFSRNIVNIIHRSNSPVAKYLQNRYVIYEPNQSLDHLLGQIDVLWTGLKRKEQA